MTKGTSPSDQSSELYPEISSIINETRFDDAKLIIESKLTSPQLTEAQKTWLESHFSICLVGSAALTLSEAKKYRMQNQNKEAATSLEKIFSTIKPHYSRLNIEPSLADQMMHEMEQMVNNSRTDEFDQLAKDRQEILQACELMLPDSIGRRALNVMLDASFEKGLLNRQKNSNEIGNNLEDIKALLDTGNFEEALEKIEMRRLRGTQDRNLQEHLDWMEKAARSVLVIQKYSAANKHFDNNDSEGGLKLYREICHLMEGHYALFKLNENALPSLVKDFESKIKSGAIQSYEDSLKYRSSYMEPLQSHFGSNSPDWKTITMVLDAHMSIALYKRLSQSGYSPKKKESWLWKLVKFYVRLWTFGLVKLK